MLNHVNLVGKVVDVTKTSDKQCYVLIEVERPYKEYDGTFHKDVIRCRMWQASKDAYIPSYPLNSKVSIAGRLEGNKDEMVVVVYELDYI